MVGMGLQVAILAMTWFRSGDHETQLRKWGASDYAGFLACPIGFVLVQYVIFIANKVRNPLGSSLLKDYWDP